MRFAVAATSFLVLVSLASTAGGSPRWQRCSASPPPLTPSSWSPSSEWPGSSPPAFTYHAIPRIAGRRVFSDFSGRLHLRMAGRGEAALGFLLWITGTVTGYTWVGAARTGSFVAAGEGWQEVESSTLVFTSLLPLAALLVAVGLLALGTTCSGPTPRARRFHRRFWCQRGAENG